MGPRTPATLRPWPQSIEDSRHSHIEKLKVCDIGIANHPDIEASWRLGIETSRMEAQPPGLAKNCGNKIVMPFEARGWVFCDVIAFLRPATRGVLKLTPPLKNVMGGYMMWQASRCVVGWI